MPKSSHRIGAAVVSVFSTFGLITYASEPGASSRVKYEPMPISDLQRIQDTFSKDKFDSNSWETDRSGRSGMVQSLERMLSNFDRTEVEEVLGASEVSDRNESNQYFLKDMLCSSLPVSSLEIQFDGERIIGSRVVYYPDGTGGSVRQVSPWREISKGAVHHEKYVPSKDLTSYSNHRPGTDTFQKTIPKLPDTLVIPDP